MNSLTELIPALDYVPQNRICTVPAQRVDLHFSAALCYKHYLSNPPSSLPFLPLTPSRSLFSSLSVDVRQVAQQEKFDTVSASEI